MKPKIQEVSSSTTDTVSVWQGLGLHCSVAPPGSDTNVPFQICRILSFTIEELGSNILLSSRMKQVLLHLH